MTTFIVNFDGGTRDQINGYGSWEVRWQGFSKKVSRTPYEARKFGQRITSNVAEYLALTGALAWLQSVKNKDRYRIVIYGDSELVLKTLTGEHIIHKAHLKPLRDTCHEFLKGFADWKTEWQGRAHNVARFGH